MTTDSLSLEKGKVDKRPSFVFIPPPRRNTNHCYISLDMENNETHSVVTTSEPSISGTSQAVSSPCPDCSFDFEASQEKLQDPPETLYAHYSGTNVYPSASDEAIVKRGIVEALEHVSLLGNKIERLNTVVALLEMERERIKDVVVKYRSMLRPIHRLPPELLSRIFSFSTENHAGIADLSEGFRGQDFPTSLRPSRHPWVLSQVCQSWRKLALNSPSLWSLVSFAFPSDHHDNSMAAWLSQCHRLQLQLQRNGDQPMSIIAKTPNPNSTSIERFLSQLCYHSPNWRDLRIELHPDTVLPWMFPISGRLQSLENLQIRLVGQHVNKDFDPF
ncbi:hypothetical protein PM082_014535 [Marasmius tenuissimus]|nr:hypothetical protein PM082_014535 [Marasmius tenuissimus]